jgi:hypothetical protein
MAKPSGQGPRKPPKGRKGGRSRPQGRWDNPPKTQGNTGGTRHKGPGGGTSGGDCCPMVSALRSVKRGKFRLARRYAGWSVRLLAARVVA